MEEKVKNAIDFLTSLGYEVIEPQSITIINQEFEKWWQIYNKKRGKSRCMRKWAQMPKKDRKACIEATPRYVASITNKVFQKDPLTYLNGRAWEDEVYTVFGEQQKYDGTIFANTAAAVFNAD
jgi:Asp-tRNA(Asn)/Glu-tRNA(Gln) amidotransferase A subunit family amidase